MTVAIGNEISINIGPAASPGAAGNSESGRALLPGAAHLSGRPAGGREGGTGGGPAESFHARWQSELAAIRSAGQGDGRGEQTAVGDADAATGRAMKSDALPGFAGANVPASRQTSGAKSSMSAGGARNSGNTATPNLEIDGRDDAPGETRPDGSAERPESKDTQNSRGARNREVHGQMKADSQNDAASLQSITGAPMEMMPLAIAQQQIQTLALTPGAAVGSSTGAPGVSTAGKAAGDTKSRLAVGGALSANAHPGRAVQPFRGLAAGGAACAAGDEQVTAAESGSVAEDGAHGAVSEGREEGPHDGFIGEAAGEGGRGLALSAASAQGAHEAGAIAQASGGSAAGAQGDSSQSTIAAASNGAADASRKAVSASRLERASNAAPSAGQNPKQVADTRIAAPGHDGSGMAIAPAVGATHGMPSQPAGAAAGAPASGLGSGPDKGAGETFASMDAQANKAGLTWVHAGAHQAEAGFQDPALGWVSVRAEMGAGGVHAAIVPGTADAAQTLGGHMAGLSAHLAEQRVGVTSVSLNNPGNGLGVAPQLAGGGAGQSGGYSNTGQGQHQPADTSGSYVAPTMTSVSGARATAHHDGGTRPVTVASGMTGRHISVVA